MTVHDSYNGDDDQDKSPPAKTQRLFSGYRKKCTKKSVDHGSSVEAELIRFIQVSPDEDEVDRLEFWKRQLKAFPRLYLVAKRVLAVPATSAPLERVFSQGGLIMCPHCASLSVKTL